MRHVLIAAGASGAGKNAFLAHLAAGEWTHIRQIYLQPDPASEIGVSFRWRVLEGSNPSVETTRVDGGAPDGSFAAAKQSGERG